MKRSFVFFASLTLCLLGGQLFQLFGQSETDAYRLSQRDLNGSARFVSMGGAFTALGGDPSSIERNPAGAAVAHSSVISFTSKTSSSTNVTINQDHLDKAHHLGSSLGDFGAIIAIFNRASGNGFTFGIHYSRIFDINRTINTRNGMPQTFSIADYVGFTTPGGLNNDDLFQNRGYDPYDQIIPWLSVLGYNAGWITPTNGTEGPFETSFYYPESAGSDRYIPFGPSSTMLQYAEVASMRESNFSFGYNYQDRLYLGVALKSSTLDYSLNTLYDENFIYGDYLTLDNSLRTTGRGFGGSIGVIGRPTEQIRLGISYHSPTFFYLSDRFEAQASSRYSFALDNNGNPFPEDEWIMRSSTPSDARTSFRLLTPSRITMGVGYTFGRYGLLSFDYEVIPLGGMKLQDNHSRPYSIDNQSIQNHYAIQQSFRIGTEWFPFKNFALRAGYMYKSPALKSSAAEHFTETSPGENYTWEGQKEQFLVAGTLPHYITQGASHNITFGLGYQTSGGFFFDGAFVYNTQKDKLYAFPTLLDQNGDLLAYSANPSSITQRNYRFYFTAGYYF